MRIIIDVLHPAHVHFFRNFISIMQKKGHKILVTARDKEMTIYLLKKYKIKYKLISKQKTGIALGVELATRTTKLLNIGRKFKADCYMGIMGPSISIVGALTGKPAYIFYDTEHAKITNVYAFKLAKKVITPESYMEEIPKKHVKYKGYHEITYLHKKYFKPDSKFLKKYGLDKEKRIYFIRFVSWGASHDIGHKGLSFETKLKLVQLLEKTGKVVINSEGDLPKEFKKYQMKIPFEEVHNLLFYSDLYIGEGATMASEAAILGTHAVYINTLPLGYINDQQRNGLVKYFDPNKIKNQNQIVKYVEKLVAKKNLKQEASKLQVKLMKDKVDVTKWMVDFVQKEIKETRNKK